MFKKASIYVKIFPNKIEVTNLLTDESITRESTQHFSTKRLLIADYNTAELLLRSVLEDLKILKKFTFGAKFIIQQMELLEGGLAEVEKRAMRDICEQAGASEVYIIEGIKALTKTELLGPEWRSYVVR